MTGAVVTGAGGGLGALIARLLVERGHTVLVTDVDGQAAQATAAALGERAIPFVLDVRDAVQVEAAREEIIRRAGRLAVWVNNAGVLITGPAWEQEPAARDLMLDVNGSGTMNGTVAAIRGMRGLGGGHIVNIISLGGLTAVPGEAVYAASKHAALGFSLGTASDLRLAGVDDIDISCICPDGIWTPMLFDKLDDPDAALSFSGVLLQPEQVVDLVGRVLDRPRAVISLPRWRGGLSRLANAFPGLGRAVLPIVFEQGRRVQKRMLAERVGEAGRIRRHQGA